MERMSRLGLGFSRMGLSIPSQEDFKLFSKYDIQFHAFLTCMAKTAYGLDGVDGIKVPVKGRKYQDAEANAIYRADPATYPDIVESCRRVALSRPDIRLWGPVNEGVIGNTLGEEHGGQYIRLLLDIARAVKKANPKAKLLTPSTCDIFRSLGLAGIEQMCRGGILDEYDIVTAHPYRPRPEVPDLAEDITALVSMLKRYGFKGDIYFDEDMNYTSYNIPKYGLDVTKFADFWHSMPLSYDAGVGERMMAAYNARSWLISLRYFPLVKNHLWWNYGSSCLDLELTPTLSCWAPSTLRHIFGKDCSFIQEIPLCDDVRCYLYRDGDGLEVAALWNINEDIDREKRPPLAVCLPFSSSEVEMIDFVGNRIDFKPGDTMKIYPTPTFLRRKDAGGFFKSVSFWQKRESFADTLVKLEVEGGQKRLVKMTTGIIDRQNVAVNIKNVTAGTLSGTLSIRDGGDVKEELNLPVAGEKTVSVKLPELNDREISKVPLHIKFTGSDGKGQDNDSSFKMMLANKASKPLTVDGDLSDWPDGNGIKLNGLINEFMPSPKYPQPIKWNGPEDLSATLHVAWDKDYFYLAIDVKDDVFCPVPSGAASFWDYDSVQIYFDTACDARNLESKNYDSTDYCYNAYCRDGKMEVKRDQVPDWQLCFLNTGPAPKVKAAFKKTEKGYVFEFAFPLIELAPMRLEKNQAIGFAVLINDNDKDYRKRGISLTAPGREPYMNPVAWPAMLLVE